MGELVGGVIVGGKFDEFDAQAFRARRHFRDIELGGGRFAAQLIHQIDERALAVDGNGARRAGAELVVEDLEREFIVIAGAEHGLDEFKQRHFALPREAAEVPAPILDIHVEPGRVGELHQEDALAGDVAQRLEVALLRVAIETIEHQADGGMIGASHHLPGVVVAADVAAPGQRLEADAQAALGRALAELAKIFRRAVDAAGRFRRHVAANEQQVAADLLHHVELALGTLERAGALLIRHALEIAERLEGSHLEAEIGQFLGHLGRRAVEGKQIAFEKLHAAEPGGGDRLQFFAQVSAQTDRGDRRFHGSSPWFLKRT